jgi:hypothetical protein
MRNKTPAVVSIFLTVVAAQAASAPASDMVVIGGSFGQTLRVTIAAPPTARCSALLEIHTGDLLPARPEDSYELGPGETAIADVNVSRLAGRIGRRVELVPSIKVLAGQCSAAVETFDVLSGRTTAYIPLLTRGTEPRVETLDLAPVGVTRNQILRVGVIRGFDPQPDPPACRVTVAFADGRGNRIGTQKTIDLSVGQFDFVDLNASLLLPAVSSFELLPARTVVQPRFLLPASGGGDIRGCDGSVQVFDQATGWNSMAVRTN